MSADDGPQSEAEILELVQSVLADRLPPGWALSPSRAMISAGRAEDLNMRVTSPDGTGVGLVVEAKRIVDGRDVAAIRRQLQESISRWPGSIGVVVARYLSRPVRQRLADAGLSYVDVTGNVRVTVSEPGLFVSDHGADRDPWRGPGRPRGTLKGAPAAKVVRLLADFDRAWPIRQLIETAKVSTGAGYRVIQFLEAEELIEKAGSQVRAPGWEPLLRRWSRDYEFLGNSRTTRWIAPRGLEPLLARAAEDTARYAVTGTIAAAEWAAYAPARAAMIYTPNASIAATAWDLRPAEAGTNVILAEPESDVVFARARRAAKGDYTVAAPSQVAVDLMTGPGRNPSEAEELIEWMKRNERSWRQ